jgi:hypothetical protein
MKIKKIISAAVPTKMEPRISRMTRIFCQENLLIPSKGFSGA